jgi:hypothetical protein
MYSAPYKFGAGWDSGGVSGGQVVQYDHLVAGFE